MTQSESTTGERTRVWLCRPCAQEVFETKTWEELTIGCFQATCVRCNRMLPGSDMTCVNLRPGHLLPRERLRSLRGETHYRLLRLVCREQLGNPLFQSLSHAAAVVSGDERATPHYTCLSQGGFVVGCASPPLPGDVCALLHFLTTYPGSRLEATDRDKCRLCRESS